MLFFAGSNSGVYNFHLKMTDNTNPLAFLRNQEPFQQMKRLLQQNPNMFGALLRHVGQSNPELFNIIRQNRDAFMLLVNEPDKSKLKIKKKNFVR